MIRPDSKPISAPVSLYYPATAGSGGKSGTDGDSGFSMIEMLIAAAILLVLSFSVFGTLRAIQHAASTQAEVRAVLDNTRNALQTVERWIRQAGNDPHQTGFEAVSIVGPTEVRLRSDITGSSGAGNPDKGDPDGDINDSGEDLSIRYNGNKKRLEIASSGGTVQIIADNISDVSLKYYDADGNPTGTGSRVRKITVTVSGMSSRKDPRTGRRFGVQMESTVRILT